MRSVVWYRELRGTETEENGSIINKSVIGDGNYRPSAMLDCDVHRCTLWWRRPVSAVYTMTHFSEPNRESTANIDGITSLSKHGHDKLDGSNG